MLFNTFFIPSNIFLLLEDGDMYNALKPKILYIKKKKNNYGKNPHIKTEMSYIHGNRKMTAVADTRILNI